MPKLDLSSKTLTQNWFGKDSSIVYIKKKMGILLFQPRTHPWYYSPNLRRQDRSDECKQGKDEA